MRWSWRWPVALAGAAAVVIFTSRTLAHSPAAALSPQATRALAADGMTPLGNRPAPGFTLTAQNGRPVSLAGFRGRAVVLAFLDPVCWSECPLQAQEMRQVDTLLGAHAGSVALLAVAANPVFHSRQDVLGFTQEEGLTAVPNWTFATSNSLATLEKVWRDYYVQVSVPQNGMVDHTQVFYIIGPRGGLDYVSSPLDRPSYAAGTSQLLATYVLRVLHLHAALGAAPETLPAPVKANPITVPGPVAADFWSPQRGMVILNSPPYQLVDATSDGGRTWTDEGPAGIVKQGGLGWSFDGPSAWVLIRPFYWMANTAVVRTDAAGATWSTPAVLAGTPAAGPQPIAGLGAAAAVLAGGRLWTTTDGTHWSSGPTLPPGVSAPGLGWSPDGTAWLGGMGPAGAHLWAARGGAWTAVTLPVPAALAGTAVTTLAPVWQDAGHAIAVCLATVGGRTMAFADATADGGARWQAALPPVAVADGSGGGVQVRGGTVYALSPRAGGPVVEAGARGLWRAEGTPVPGGAGQAVDFLNASQGFAITGGPSGTHLYATSDGGAHWSAIVLPQGT